MKQKLENDTINDNVQLMDTVNKSQAFGFKIFFGLIETLFRYSVALKLILDSQQIHDQELSDFYVDFKQFIAVFRLGFSPKRE